MINGVLDIKKVKTNLKRKKCVTDRMYLALKAYEPEFDARLFNKISFREKMNLIHN